MNRICVLCAVAGVLLAMVIMVPAFAQGNQSPSAVVALPDMAELPGFTQEYVEARANTNVLLQALRGVDQLRITVYIDVFATAGAAKRWPAQYNSGVQLLGAGLKRMATPPRYAGQEWWCDRLTGYDNFRVVVIDGRSIVTVLVEPRIDSDERGFAVRRGHTADDVRSAETLASSTMFRMTALGLTSRQASSAPARAKQQVSQRLQRLAHPKTRKRQ